MQGIERQQIIKEKLLNAETTISANQFAKLFEVSRQTIVGDIALLRATGEKIDSTPQGYRYQQPRALSQIVVVQHTADQMALELNTLIDVVVSIEDVQVEHPIYGLLKGALSVHTKADVEHFIDKYNETQGELLSSLTNGLHMHLLTYDEPDQLEMARQKLDELGMLYHN
ncbi:transcription repressor NadR [Weissella minor]|uniref:transcription repressor NadR n=1 Tax=Weissella minor TaxID=1620 RepID=UPI001BAE5AB4|nr:transcription repressor NadR [Weissella minor]MBS0949683.1 transcription repressor NadR [Weissella minor]